MDQNWIDIVLIAVLTFFIITGLWKGFIKALFGLASILAGAFVSYSFTESFHIYISEIFEETPSFLPVIIAVVLFLVTLFTVQYAGTFINKLINATPLNMANRLSGAALGIVKTYIFAILFFGVLEYLAPLSGSVYNTLTDSGSYYLYNKIPFSPEDIYQAHAESDFGKSLTQKMSEIKNSSEMKYISRSKETFEKLEKIQ